MSFFARLARLALWIAIAGLAGATAVSFLGRFLWAAELLTHFRVQLAAGAAALAIAALLLRARAAFALAAACLAVHLAPLLPYVVPRADPPPLAGLPTRVLLLNVLTANRHTDAVAALIWREDPDVIGLVEVDARWTRALAPVRARYPYRLDHPQADNFGIALWSRVPLADAELRTLHHESVRVAVAGLAIGGRPTVLLVAHPAPPGRPRLAALRDRQIETLARIRNEFPDREAILIGDLNTSPWSPIHARLEGSAQLANARRGLGILPSWPAGAWWLQTPIDHCLLSPGLRAASLRVGPYVGSDHLPVIVEIAAR